MRDIGWNISVTSSQVNWTGLGADDNASTPANWAPTMPLPGDSLAFGASPRTDVNLDVTLYSIGSVTFAADAPAYIVTFDRQKSTDITGRASRTSPARRRRSSWRTALPIARIAAAQPSPSKPGRPLSNATFEVLGGGTDIEHPPNLPPRYVHGAGGLVVFEGNARAELSSFTVEGGRGFEGPQAKVIFRGTASAETHRFHNQAGRFGVMLPGPPALTNGFGGETRFEGNSNAGTNRNNGSFSKRWRGRTLRRHGRDHHVRRHGLGRRRDV